MTNTANLTIITNAINNANKRWATKEGKQEGIFSPDLSRALKFATEENITHAFSLLEKLGEGKAQQFAQKVANDMGNKAIMRALEFFACIHAKNYTLLDGVTALQALSAAYAGAETRDAIFFAATGKGEKLGTSMSDEVKGLAMVRKLQKVLPLVAVGTEGTQNSRSFGKNGFCHALEMGYMQKDKAKINRLHVSKSNPFFRCIVAMVETASEQTLKQMRGTSEE